jgi:ferric-dicitrate binding protein FerR (iron transport regulator)
LTKEQLKASIQAGIESRIQAHKKRQRKKLFIGASFIILPLLLLTGWFLLPTPTAAIAQYSTHTGQFDTIYMKDGSRLSLAGNSTITVSESDTGSSVTLLYGECFFEIEKQKKHPFQVITNDTRTTVVGTAFTVSKPDAAKPAEIRLKEGKISIAANQQQTVLYPGERFFWDEQHHQFGTDSISTEAIGNWRADRIVWDKLNIRQIIFQLENIFPIKISATDNVLAQHHQYSLSFNRSISIESLLEILSAITSDEKLKFELNKQNQSISIKK